MNHFLEIKSMITSKESKELEELAGIFKVISDENRLKIISLLIKRELCVCEIIEQLNLSQSLTSHHLAILRSIGLVKFRKNNKWVYYSINRNKLNKLNSKCLNLFNLSKIEPVPIEASRQRNETICPAC
ncbi:MAG: winged helix-turn-helix transcriptional regulator [Actinobacteria bacterium]|nr:winged helix-turn-helix transcriptional regulator [Actinomycetota bacterium]